MLKEQINTLGSARELDKPAKDCPDSGLTFKIALVGPRQGGKTRIAHQLAGTPVPNEEIYEPTAGVRIVEFTDKVKPNRNRDYCSVKVELWDLSGDQQFEPCWPAVVRDLSGIAVVFDPTSKQQANDVRIWCEWFCKAANLTSGQCVIFAHGALTARHKPLQVRTGGPNDPISVPIVNVNYKLTAENPTSGEEVEVPSGSKIEFNKFLNGIWSFHPENRNSEEEGNFS